MRIAYNLNGRLHIFTAAPKSALERALGALTQDEYRDHVYSRCIPSEAADVTEVGDDWELPADRTFRDAWRLAGGRVDTCMVKARAIHRDQLRAERGKLLPRLDVQYMRALEAGDTGAARSVAAIKQRLRDAPASAAIDDAETPEALKALTLASLAAD